MSKIEIYLNKDNDRFRFPVIPSSIAQDGKALYNSETMAETGEMSIFNGKGLKEVTWNSHFPVNGRNYCDYLDFPSSLDCKKKLERWMDEGAVLRLTIPGMDINIECTITNFSPVIQDGTGDIYYDITLKEYLRIKISKVEDKPNPKPSDSTSRPSQNTTNQKTHAVKKGDSLWSIAQKYYGKGSLYPKIKEANKNKYPKLKTSNVIYVNWVLIIP